MRKGLVILNASSGWSNREGAPAMVREMLHSRGIDCTVTRVAAGTDIRQLAAAAVRDGAEIVVAGGGDGTLRAVAEALAGTGVAMGVLPVGTLNHFARDMEIPLDLRQAAETAGAGVPVTVDVGEVDGNVFINNAVIGFYPAYRFERERRERRGWRKWLAAAAALLTTFRRLPLLDVRLSGRGIELSRRSPYIVIANNEHAMEGFRPWQRDSMTDGMLWVYVARHSSRWAMLRALARALTGRLRAEEDFEVLRASDIWIETPQRRIGVSLDGEVLPMRTPLHFRSRPRDLRVIAPPESRRVAEFVCETGGVPSAR